MPLKDLAEDGDNHCWYAQIQEWFESHGICINALRSNSFGIFPLEHDQNG